MPSWIKRILQPRRQKPFDPPRPKAPLYVIGDIHGRFDLFEQLWDQLDTTHHIVCVGDYIDRGEASADVLRRLMTLTQGNTVTCLLGNHEEMLLGFLDAPQTQGGIWLRNGGLQTLAGFGVTGLSETTTGVDLTKARNDLQNAMGKDMIDWLQNLPLTYQSGNIVVVHAGADPRLPMDKQTKQHLIWGHSEFFKSPRTDNLWIAHGHTVTTHPKAEFGRISTDTGAYATGHLTVAGISLDGVEFWST